MFAVCCNQRPHYAHGKCHTCYQRDWRKANPVPSPKRRKARAQNCREWRQWMKGQGLCVGCKGKARSGRTECLACALARSEKQKSRQRQPEVAA